MFGIRRRSCRQPTPNRVPNLTPTGDLDAAVAALLSEDTSLRVLDLGCVPLTANGAVAAATALAGNTGLRYFAIGRRAILWLAWAHAQCCDHFHSASDGVLARLPCTRHIPRRCCAGADHYSGSISSRRQPELTASPPLPAAGANE